LSIYENKTKCFYSWFKAKFIVYTNNKNKKKNVIGLSTVIIALFIFSMITNPLTLTTFGARSDVGFQDGLSDCQTGTSDAINGHSNAGHHSAAYMEAYNRGLASCNTGSNSGTSDTGSKGFNSSGSNPIETSQINWEELCNQYHDALSLKAPCSTYAQGTQLTQAGQQALFCLGGGLVTSLISLVGISNPGLATAIKVAQTAGERTCP
jgi:hypothetical protein